MWNYERDNSWFVLCREMEKGFVFMSAKHLTSPIVLIQLSHPLGQEPLE